MMEYSKRRLWKYKLEHPIRVLTDIVIDRAHLGEYIGITDCGAMLIAKGYCWDGASSIAKDTKTIMRGSLIHDALYQLMREGVLPQSARKRADEIMREICLEDGMSRFRAWYVYTALRLPIGNKHAKSNVLTAP
jgi:hypothetical protein